MCVNSHCMFFALSTRARIKRKMFRFVYGNRAIDIASSSQFRWMNGHSVRIELSIYLFFGNKNCIRFDIFAFDTLTSTRAREKFPHLVRIWIVRMC